MKAIIGIVAKHREMSKKRTLAFISDEMNGPIIFVK